MVKISKEADMTPEEIAGKLFSFANIAHKYHLDTKSYAEHRALGSLYKGLNDFKDEISEKLMGYTGKRIGKIKLEEIPDYSTGKSQELTKSIEQFAYALYEWAANKKYCDLENIAQSLSGLSSQTLYLLTLT